VYEEPPPARLHRSNRSNGRPSIGSNQSQRAPGTYNERTAHTRRQTTASRKAGNLLKAAGHRRSSAAGQESKAAQLARERDEALEQLSAASDVLCVISSSPGKLKPVFQRRGTADCGKLAGPPELLRPRPQRR
jgi:hypothetical protein